MTTLSLAPDLMDVLQTEAVRVGKSVPELVEEWLRQQYHAVRRARLAEQTQRFWAKYTELYATYPNQFVAFYNDQVLDHDSDMRQLAIRIKAAYGDLSVVIAQVTTQPIRNYRILSPRLRKNSQ